MALKTDILKINILLFGYSDDVDKNISKTPDFHLAHKTNPDFIFEPKETTDKIIWKYLTSFNLLSSSLEIDI